MFTEGASTTSASNNVVVEYYDKPFLKRLGSTVHFAKLGGLMATGDCEGNLETPLQAEIRHLKYQVQNEKQCIENARERLLIARTKLAAVKALVK